MKWFFYSHLVLWCTNRHQNKPIFSCLYLWDGVLTRILPFDVQTVTKTNQFLSCNKFSGWCFYSHLVLRYANWHQNNPIFSCLCLHGGASSRILYFSVQAGTKNNPIFSCLCLCVVLFLASCTSMYKQAPKQTFFSCSCLWRGAFSHILYFDVQTGTKTIIFLVVYVDGWCFYSHLVLRCTNRHQNKPISQGFSCLCLWDGALNRNLYFGVQTGTNTTHFVVVYVYEVSL